jgi:heptose I phosphotransferase
LVILKIDKDFVKTFSNQIDLFDQIMAIDGEIYRALEGRRTLRFTLGNKAYFIKQHFGIGWKEIFKNLLQLRLPITNAKNEWEAIRKLNELNIPTFKITAYGKRGIIPASMQSFIITEELKNIISLEDFCHNWKNPNFVFKTKIICALAETAKTMHHAGMNHRDFYLCHFLLDQKKAQTGKVYLYLIDLHRAQIRNKTPYRWMVKDIAGLYFSAMNVGLTKRDIIQFLKIYFGRPLRDIIRLQHKFLYDAEKRAFALYEKTFNTKPPIPAYFHPLTTPSSN